MYSDDRYLRQRQSEKIPLNSTRTLFQDGSLPRSQAYSPLFSPLFNNLPASRDATEYNVQSDKRSSPLNLQAKYTYSAEQSWPTFQNYRTASPISQQTANFSLGSNQNGSFESSTAFQTKELEKDLSMKWESHFKRRHSGDWTRQLGSFQTSQSSTPQRSNLRLSSTPSTGQSVRFRKELEFSGVDGNLSFRSMDDTFDSKVVSVSNAGLGFPTLRNPGNSSTSTTNSPPQSTDCTPSSVQTVTNASSSPKCQSYEVVTNWQYFFSKEHQELNEKCRTLKRSYRDSKENTVHVVTSYEKVLKLLLLSFFVITFGLYIIFLHHQLRKAARLLGCKAITDLLE